MTVFILYEHLLQKTTSNSISFRKLILFQSENTELHRTTATKYQFMPVSFLTSSSYKQVKPMQQRTQIHIHQHWNLQNQSLLRETYVPADIYQTILSTMDRLPLFTATSFKSLTKGCHFLNDISPVHGVRFMFGCLGSGHIKQGFQHLLRKF